MQDEQSDRPHPGTAPHEQEAEDADRMEGSYEPGAEHESEQPETPAQRSEEQNKQERKRRTNGD